MSIPASVLNESLEKAYHCWGEYLQRHETSKRGENASWELLNLVCIHVPVQIQKSQHHIIRTCSTQSQKHATIEDLKEDNQEWVSAMTCTYNSFCVHVLTGWAGLVARQKLMQRLWWCYCCSDHCITKNIICVRKQENIIVSVPSQFTTAAL